MNLNRLPLACQPAVPPRSYPHHSRNSIQSRRFQLDEEDLSDVTGLAEDKAQEIENYMNNWEDNKTEAGVIVGICADVILLLTLFVTLCCCEGGCNKKASLLIKNLVRALQSGEVRVRVRSQCVGSCGGTNNPIWRVRAHVQGGLRERARIPRAVGG